MTRLYETVTEKQAREQREYYAGVASAAPVDFPPPRARRRSVSEVRSTPFSYVTNEDLVIFPRQTVEQMVRKQVEVRKRQLRAFARLSKTNPF